MPDMTTEPQGSYCEATPTGGARLTVGNQGLKQQRNARNQISLHSYSFQPLFATGRDGKQSELKATVPFSIRQGLNLEQGVTDPFAFR